jgi:hypothetical protein
MDREGEGRAVMRALLIAALALAGCAASTPSGPAPTGPLALHAERAAPAEISAAFAREIALRYPGELGGEAVRKDLVAQGFQCADSGASPEVRVGEIYARCDLPKPHGLCSDRWIVDLRLKGLTRALDFARVTPEGRFERSCVGGASTN